jgi:hypothetical protein
LVWSQLLSSVFGSSLSEYLYFLLFFYVFKSLPHFSFHLFPHNVHHCRFNIRMDMSSLARWLLWNDFINHFFRYMGLAMRGVDFKSLLLNYALLNPLVAVGIVSIEGFKERLLVKKLIISSALVHVQKTWTLTL